MWQMSVNETEKDLCRQEAVTARLVGRSDASYVERPGQILEALVLLTRWETDLVAARNRRALNGSRNGLDLVFELVMHIMQQPLNVVDVGKVSVQQIEELLLAAWKLIAC
jgi:hypothetical protein